MTQWAFLPASLGTSMAKKNRDRDFARMVGKMLQAHGYELTNIDSNDKAMTAALLDFQTKRGLRKTGTATPQTFEALKQPPIEVQPLAITAESGTDEGTFTQTGGLTLVNEPPSVEEPQPEQSADDFLAGWEKREGFEAPNVTHRPPVSPRPPVVVVTPEERAKQELREQLPVPGPVTPQAPVIGEFQTDNPRFDPSNRVFQSVVGNPNAAQDAALQQQMEIMARKQAAAASGSNLALSLIGQAPPDDYDLSKEDIYDSITAFARTWRSLPK